MFFKKNKLKLESSRDAEREKELYKRLFDLRCLLPINQSIGRFFSIVSDGRSLSTFINDPDGKKVALVTEAVIRISANEKLVKLELIKLDDQYLKDVGTASLDLKVSEQNTRIKYKKLEVR